MPVYNGAKYLEETLGSLVGQTFEDFELLILKDFAGRTSGTWRMRRSLAAPNG